MRWNLLLAVVLGLYAAPAAAYIDPGTGSALVYVVMAVVISVYFALRGLALRVLELGLRVGVKQRKCTIAIHSEDRRYEITFLPIMEALTERGVPFTYFTMYPRGPDCAPLPTGAIHHEIRPGLMGYSFLNSLEAEILVTTTPQLDVMTFRRSRRVKHYCHVPHALGESIYVRPYAYDFFDSVFCCGEILARNIRKIEFVRKLKPKMLFETGVPHYDVLVRERRDPSPAEGTRRCVLVAPSWGPMSLFTRFGTGFLRAIAERYDVVVRPHPQMRVSQKELYAEILALQGVVVDTAPTPASAMQRADLLISDISGIMHEFSFIHEKPVVVVDAGRCAEGLEGHLIGGRSELQEQCRQFIVPIAPEEVPRLADIVDRTLAQHDVTRVTAARDRLVHHFGRSGHAAAAQLEEILRCL